MSTNSSIEWTDATWNPLVGCSRVSAGCEHCYAERFMHRGLHHKGLTRSTSRGPVWTGEVRLVEKALDLPLRWRKPRRVFVNSLSDLFHESVPDEWIDRVFAVMALAHWHTFQLLTKRADRLPAYLTAERRMAIGDVIRARAVRGDPRDGPRMRNIALLVERGLALGDDEQPSPRWPLPNVHLGVSCENQEAADERVPVLLQTPAAVRFVSAEPLLGPIDFGTHLRRTKTIHFGADVEGMIRHRSFDGLQHDDGRPMSRREAEDALYAIHAKGVKVISCGGCDAFDPQEGCPGHQNERIDWVIVGGESGPGARPCDVGWIRSIVEQCREAGTACFVKQLGSNAVSWCFLDGDEHNKPGRYRTKHRKGADPLEWPESIRVRELPDTTSRAESAQGGK